MIRFLVSLYFIFNLQICLGNTLQFVNFDNVEVISSSPLVTSQIVTGNGLDKLAKLFAIEINEAPEYINTKDNFIDENFPFVVKAKVKNNRDNIIFLQSIGTESGGGSGSIYDGSQFRLIDFYNLPLEFSPIAQNKKTHKDFRRSYNKISDIIQGTKNLIQQWEDLSKRTIMPTVFTPTVRGSLKVLSFIPVDSIDEELSHFIPSININKSEIINMANYSRTKNGFKPIFINKKILNSPKIDQHGVILHEIMRHIQINFRADFNDKTLQQITALLLVCKPEVNLSYYTYTLISGRTEAALQNYGTYSEVIKRWCVNKYE